MAKNNYKVAETFLAVERKICKTIEPYWLNEVREIVRRLNNLQRAIQPYKEKTNGHSLQRKGIWLGCSLYSLLAVFSFFIAFSNPIMSGLFNMIGLVTWLLMHIYRMYFSEKEARDIGQVNVLLCSIYKALESNHGDCILGMLLASKGDENCIPLFEDRNRDFCFKLQTLPSLFQDELLALREKIILLSISVFYDFNSKSNQDGLSILRNLMQQLFGQWQGYERASQKRIRSTDSDLNQLIHRFKKAGEEKKLVRLTQEDISQVDAAYASTQASFRRLFKVIDPNNRTAAPLKEEFSNDKQMKVTH